MMRDRIDTDTARLELRRARIAIIRLRETLARDRDAAADDLGIGSGGRGRIDHAKRTRRGREYRQSIRYA